MHSDMWIVPLDAKLAMIYPPWCRRRILSGWLDAIGYELIECPRDEIELYPERNAITIEPRRVIMNATAHKTRRLLDDYDVEVITVEYDEVHKYGGGIRCNTMQLIRAKARQRSSDMSARATIAIESGG